MGGSNIPEVVRDECMVAGNPKSYLETRSARPAFGSDLDMALKVSSRKRARVRQCVTGSLLRWGGCFVAAKDTDDRY